MTEAMNHIELHDVMTAAKASTPCCHAISWQCTQSCRSTAFEELVQECRKSARVCLFLCVRFRGGEFLSHRGLVKRWVRNMTDWFRPVLFVL